MDEDLIMGVVIERRERNRLINEIFRSTSSAGLEEIMFSSDGYISEKYGALE